MLILDINKYKKAEILINNVLNFNYFLYLFGGAVKGGKTYSAIAAAILMCNEHSNCRIVVMRKDMPVLERNTKPVLNKLIPLAYSDGIKQHKGYFSLPFYNGSEIIFLGENFSTDKELNRFRGFDINGAILEELNELQEQTFDKVIERVGTNRPSCNIPPFIIATCNPTFNWVKKRLYDRMNSNECPKDWLFIKSSVFDNPAYGVDQIEFWRNNMSDYEFKMFIEGNWNLEMKKGALLKLFNPSKHIKKAPYEQGRAVHISLDNNVNPYISITFWQVDSETKRIWQFYELPLRNPDNLSSVAGEKIVSYLLNINHCDKIFIYGDASGQNKTTADRMSFFDRIIFSIKQTFSDKVDKRVGKSNPPKALSFEFSNLVISGKYDWKVSIDENCEISILDYMETLEAEDGGIKKIMVHENNGVTYEKNGHICDTLKYFFVSLLQLDFIKYKKIIK